MSVDVGVPRDMFDKNHDCSQLMSACAACRFWQTCPKWRSKRHNLSAPVGHSAVWGLSSGAHLCRIRAGACLLPARYLYEHVLDDHCYLFDTKFFLHFGFPRPKAKRFESGNSLASRVRHLYVSTHFYWAGNCAGLSVSGFTLLLHGFVVAPKLLSRAIRLRLAKQPTKVRLDYFRTHLSLPSANEMESEPCIPFG